MAIRASEEARVSQEWTCLSHQRQVVHGKCGLCQIRQCIWAQPQLHALWLRVCEAYSHCYHTHPVNSFSTTLRLGCSLHPYHIYLTESIFPSKRTCSSFKCAFSAALRGLPYKVTIISSQMISLVSSKLDLGTFLVVQWIRIRLPMPETWVWSLVQENSTCRGALSPGPTAAGACVPGACAPGACAPGACAPRREKPVQRETQAPRRRAAPTRSR